MKIKDCKEVRNVIDKNKISSNLNYIKGMTQNGASPPLDEEWDEIVAMLSEDSEETKKYLKQCEAHEISIMAGYFDDIAYNLQDKSFIEFLYQLQNEHPSIEIKRCIEQAQHTLEA